MKIQYYLILLAGLVSVFLVAAECGSYTLVPQKIERQASWATLNNSEWQFRWKDSPRDQNPRFVYDSRIEMDVTSRATAWFNQSRGIGALLLATPDISVAGFSQNPFKTQSDEWIIREIARQGGPTARQELDIRFDPATVPLEFQERVTAQTSLGIALSGSRFRAETPEGDGYVAVLRGVHQEDVLALITISQSIENSRTADSVASFIQHPAPEPVAVTPKTLQCTVFATREGLVGGITANGHRITGNDRFVALPSRKVLASKNENEYQIRITHGNKTVTVPVWDVGPWNIDDNYWDLPAQRQWQGLPQCVPQAQAAYQQGYNNGQSGLGRPVLNPAGIDLSEGVWSDLGMIDNDWVTVEFLWTNP